MAHKHFLIPAEKIVRGILWLRGQRVMLDVDLAELYGVSAKHLSQQVRRHLDRFPEDFMFLLSIKETKEVASNCGHLRRLKFSRTRPRAFTEHGAIMLASVLNSPTAVDASVSAVPGGFR